MIKTIYLYQYTITHMVITCNNVSTQQQYMVHLSLLKKIVMLQVVKYAKHATAYYKIVLCAFLSKHHI